MRIEKIILSLVAVIAGLFVAGIAFYIYETAHSISPSSIKTITLQKPTPTGPAVPLLIESPNDESVSTSRIITLSGKTLPSATVIITTDSTDTVAYPTTDGEFSLTLTLPSGENRVIITAVMPDGTQTQKQLTVNVESENF